jgi:Methyltransferase domain
VVSIRWPRAARVVILTRRLTSSRLEMSPSHPPARTMGWGPGMTMVLFAATGQAGSPVPPSTKRARRAYDRIGRLQDTRRFYEDSVTRRLAELGAFEQARWVFELGCGTSRFAADLLRHRLPEGARYRGVEISPRMASLARRRLARWAPPAEMVLIQPPGRVLPGSDGQFDRFVARYGLDLPCTRMGVRSWLRRTGCSRPMGCCA